MKTSNTSTHSAGQEAVADYANTLPEEHAAICRLLLKEIDATLPKATSKIWHSMPVWFIGENPVVGYKAKPTAVNLMFWSGRLFGETPLRPVGKFQAADIDFQDRSAIDTQALRRWLKKAGTEIWDYQGHFQRHKALQREKKNRPQKAARRGRAARRR